VVDRPASTMAGLEQLFNVCVQTLTHSAMCVMDGSGPLLYEALAEHTCSHRLDPHHSVLLWRRLTGATIARSIWIMQG
jgi:hypothetical protein